MYKFDTICNIAAWSVRGWTS